MTNPHFQEKKNSQTGHHFSITYTRDPPSGDTGFAIGPSPEPVNSVGCNFLRFWAVRAERGRGIRARKEDKIKKKKRTTGYAFATPEVSKFMS